MQRAKELAAGAFVAPPDMPSREEIFLGEKEVGNKRNQRPIIRRPSDLDLGTCKGGQDLL